jgi:hypothetical protein
MPATCRMRLEPALTYDSIHVEPSHGWEENSCSSAGWSGQAKRYQDGEGATTGSRSPNAVQ